MTKGKAARIETVLLESNTQIDPAVRENNCQFILYTNVLEVIDAGTSDIANPRPLPIVIGSAPNDPRPNAPNDNRRLVPDHARGRTGTVGFRRGDGARSVAGRDADLPPHGPDCHSCSHRAA